MVAVFGCWRVVQRLADLLAGDLDPWEHQAVQAHLAGCARCDDAFDRTRRLEALLRSARDVEIPHASRRRLEGLIDRLETRDRVGHAPTPSG